MKKITFQRICILILGLLLCVGCSKTSSEKDNNEKPISEQQESVEVKPEVIFATADDKPLYSYIESRGVVEANREIQLKPRISGYVERSDITEGREVTKGDTLLVFADEEFSYDLQKAKNRYRQARSEYKIESRSQGAVLANADDRPQGVVRNDTLVRIFSGLAEAKLDLQRARTEFSYTTMTAPFSGKLATSERQTSGSFVNSGTQVGRLICY